MSKTLPPPAVYGINSAQRVLEQGALVVRLEDYEQLQARVKELEAEKTELRRRAEQVRIALKERTVAKEDSSLRREFEAKEFDKRCPSFLVRAQADDEGGSVYD